MPDTDLPSCVRTSVHGEFDVPHAVALARRFSLGHGATELVAAHVATATSELANNLWIHATRGGALQLCALRDGMRLGVEVMCQDDGPGIADVDRALEDGYSTTGGLGCGLPGVRRLMDDFEIQSSQPGGTVVRARKWWPVPARP